MRVFDIRGLGGFNVRGRGLSKPFYLESGVLGSQLERHVHLWAKHENASGPCQEVRQVPRGLKGVSEKGADAGSTQACSPTCRSAPPLALHPRLNLSRF